MIYDRSNSPVEPGVLERVMHRLDHRGPDGQDTWYSDSISMGHWHFWTTPEEINERQPLKLSELPYTIVLDGRLDNRSDFINRLSINSEEGSHLSDAILILKAYDRWGTNCFKDLIGDFAFAIWDEYHKELVCARDAIGDRTLFYTILGSTLLIASEPWPLAASLNQQVEIDEVTLGCHFSLRVPEDGRTMFKGINELLPAHWMKINDKTIQFQKYWQPSIENRTHKRTTDDLAVEFRELLKTSISDRLRSSTPPGVMLSGGLDSASIVCLAAGLLAPVQLNTISYVFNTFNKCDERPYINAVTEQYNTRSIQVPCDDIWPFASFPECPIDPNAPSANPYRLILERTYARAQEEGLRVLLTGMFGDNLYSMSSEWLADLFWDGKMGQLGEEISYLLKKQSYSKSIKSRLIWQASKQIFVRLPGFGHIRRRSKPPNWLTPYGASLVKKQFYTKGSEKTHPLLNMRDAVGASREIYNTNRFNLDLRSPYHDRRLIEFVFGLPAYTLYSKGVTRRILRDSMVGALPESIRVRPGKTNLLSLYNYGLQQKKQDMETLLFSQNVTWRKYVSESVLCKEWQIEVTKESSGARSLLPCLCILFELWYKSSGRIQNLGGTNGFGQ